MLVLRKKFCSTTIFIKGGKSHRPLPGTQGLYGLKYTWGFIKAMCSISIKLNQCLLNSTKPGILTVYHKKQLISFLVIHNHTCLQFVAYGETIFCCCFCNCYLLNLLNKLIRSKEFEWQDINSIYKCPNPSKLKLVEASLNNHNKFYSWHPIWNLILFCLIPSKLTKSKNVCFESKILNKNPMTLLLTVHFKLEESIKKKRSF